MIQLSRAEQEFTMRFDAEERIAHIYSAYPAMTRKQDKLVAEHPDEYKCVFVDDEIGSKQYTVPMKYVARFGKPASEARKEASRKKAERMRTAKAAKNK